MISPPSCATAGRTRVSINSLIWETTSSSSSSPASTIALSATASNTGRPAVKCSMITVRIAGFNWYQSLSPSFVTVIKSAPKKTPVTCGRENSRSASGEVRAATSGSVKFAVPEAMTVRPGRNFRVAGFGVCSVWINIDGSDGWTKQSALIMGGQRGESTLGSLYEHSNRGRQRSAPRRPASTDGVELLQGEAARDDRDRDTKPGGGFTRQVGD